MSDTNINYSTYSLMQTGTPIKMYRKTIKGNLTVEVLNSFSERPEIILLHGENNLATATVKLWNEKEMMYFLKVNRKALETGKLIEQKDINSVIELSIEPYADATDELLEKLLDGRKTPWFAFLKELATMGTEAVLIRLLELARKSDRSEKVISAIESKLSEVQGFSDEQTTEK